MANKVWVVTYTSHFDDLYSESKVFKSERKALQELADYVRDIFESANTSQTLEDFADEGFMGDHCFKYSDGIHDYRVDVTKTEEQ